MIYVVGAALARGLGGIGADTIYFVHRMLALEQVGALSPKRNAMHADRFQHHHKGMYQFMYQVHVLISQSIRRSQDSKSSGPKLIPFLIRQENSKYLWKTGSLKFDLLCFGWFNLYWDLFFEEIMNLATKLLHLA